MSNNVKQKECQAVGRAVPGGLNPEAKYPFRPKGFRRRADRTLYTRAFTLIELLVVLAIFIIITAVVLARQNKFSSDILLTDLAYQVAISIRQAQVYGLGVRGANNNFNVGYGVNFNSAPATSYTFFSDTNKNGIGPGGLGENNSVISLYQLQKGEKIFAVCGINSNGTSCISSGNRTFFNIIYIRPDPSAIITSDQSTSQPQNPDGTYSLPPINTYSSLVITVVSGIGDRYKCVTVYQTGQVSVSNTIKVTGNPCL